ncbi:MAG: hypothetical protein LBI59_11450, partial [Candidatus Accumulibacter sp.]|nr:hypothetical protein [Accumulibacter sp.]
MGWFDFLKRTPKESVRPLPSVYSREEVAREQRRKSRGSPPEIADSESSENGTGAVMIGDERITELHRQATQLKNSGRWTDAIEALHEAQTRMRASGAVGTIETWGRLPLYLQRTGLFEEAMAEFRRLLDEVPARMEREFGHWPKRFHCGFCHRERQVIYDKMRLACQRQGLFENAKKYSEMRDQEAEKAAEF